MIRLLLCWVAKSSQIIYLVVLMAGELKPIPTLSLILIAAIYSLQTFVFIMCRKWDMVSWMVFYILTIPAFSFFLPLDSFWRMDDFSWGQTRIVMGEAGKKMIVHVRPSLSFEQSRSSHFVLRTKASSIRA